MSIWPCHTAQASPKPLLLIAVDNAKYNDNSHHYKHGYSSHHPPISVLLGHDVPQEYWSWMFAFFFYLIVRLIFPRFFANRGSFAGKRITRAVLPGLEQVHLVVGHHLVGCV